MLTLTVKFPWGRYYAHPWGQNPVRIAEAEWPPSPWRLLRAIAAAWFRQNVGQPASSELLELLESLGRELPVIQLPKVSFSKTVHYHPNPGVPSGKVRHENHFVATGGDVLFQWSLKGIAADNRVAEAARIKQILDGILGDISYFGRAESVCEVSASNDAAAIDPSQCATIVINDKKPGRRIAPDCRNVFCPNPDDFQATDLWQIRNNANRDPSLAPKHLVQDLLDTPQPLPDGAAWYSYKMPTGWPERFVIRHARPAKRPTQSTKVIAHYLEFSLQCRIPVPTKHIVSLASSFRAAAIKNFKRGDSTRTSFALSGHDRPPDAEGEHLHAFYLPIPNEADTALERLRVWCRHGFTQREINAVMSVGQLYWANGRFPVRPILLQMTRELPEPKSNRWRSLTPFVPPRHWYRKKIAEGRIREQDSPELQLSRSLNENGMTMPAEITRDDSNGDWAVCKVHLPKSSMGKDADHRIGLMMNIEFESPVALSFPAFGHSCHFGLGQFVPV